MIEQVRSEQGLTQDQLGERLGISGPAVFKMEKGYVRPRLERWLEIAREAEIGERNAVLLWLQTALPGEYKHLVVPEFATAGAEPSPDSEQYGGLKERAEILAAARTDGNLGRGLREFLIDEDLWALYKPTGEEIRLLRDAFGRLGRGSKDGYRQALRLMREIRGPGGATSR